jgi:hypothetical protein
MRIANAVFAIGAINLFAASRLMLCFLLHLFSVRCSADFTNGGVISTACDVERAGVTEHCCCAHDWLE